MIGVYVHIPYCRTLCPYCDFVRVSAPGQVPDVYIDALCAEIASFAGPDELGSIFLGGGTPSLLAPASLERVLSALEQRFRFKTPEITIEVNPDDITPPLVETWRALGVNRVSLGVQSFDDRVLRYLGRRHDAGKAKTACEIVAAQFDNWSMDLIYGGHPVAAWTDTLRQCGDLSPPHVAAYGLTYEPGTPFGPRSAEAIDDDESLRLYDEAESALSAYDHYEISNFAKPSRASVHNLIYWRNEEYAGFGAGAYAFIGGTRARNAPDVSEYIAAPGKKSESLHLNLEEIKIETLIQHFRLRAGLEKAAYARRFDCGVYEDFKSQLTKLRAAGLIEEDAEYLRPTAAGFRLNNEIGLALVD